MFALSGIERRHEGRRVLQLPALELAGPGLGGGPGGGPGAGPDGGPGGGQGSGGLTAIVGPNGSGKSTLLSLLARQAAPDAGTVRLNGRALAGYGARAFAREVGYLPQRLPPVPGLTVRELAGLGRYPWRGALGRWRAQDREAVAAALERTGTLALADLPADALSGGERQRAWIAMLLAQQTPVLLLDEPTSALDPAHAHEVMGLLRALADAAGRRILVVLHDINLVARFADRVIALSQGQLAYDGPPGGFVDPALLARLYGIAMRRLDTPAGPVAVVA